MQVQTKKHVELILHSSCRPSRSLAASRGAGGWPTRINPEIICISQQIQISVNSPKSSQIRLKLAKHRLRLPENRLSREVFISQLRPRDFTLKYRYIFCSSEFRPELGQIGRTLEELSFLASQAKRIGPHELSLNFTWTNGSQVSLKVLIYISIGP